MQLKDSMTDIEKIRQEIERLKKILEESTYYLDNSQQALGYSFALDDFKEFIDSLPEKPDKSLKVTAEEYSKKVSDGHNYRDLTCGFIAGTEWQKEQMMKEAVEADVNTYEDLAAGKSWAEFVVKMPTNNLGDKVRIIIVKEE